MQQAPRLIHRSLVVLGLLDEIRTVQHHLAALASVATVHPMPQRDAELDRFLRNLAVAWRAGEVRPTHRPASKAPRWWCSRRDPFETTWPRVVQLLETEPDRTAKQLLKRLRRRTLQRRVKDWLRLEAHRPRRGHRRLRFDRQRALDQQARPRRNVRLRRGLLAEDVVRRLLSGGTPARPCCAAPCGGADLSNHQGSLLLQPSLERR